MTRCDDILDVALKVGDPSRMKYHCLYSDCAHLVIDDSHCQKQSFSAVVGGDSFDTQISNANMQKADINQYVCVHKCVYNASMYACAVHVHEVIYRCTYVCVFASVWRICNV